jgi:hypothetical protein
MQDVLPKIIPMRTLSGIAATILLLFSASAENSFLDDAPKGFIHIRETAESAIADTYVRTTKIVSVEFLTPDKEKKESIVMVHTTGLKGSGGLAYSIKFDSRADALKCANRIMDIAAAND